MSNIFWVHWIVAHNGIPFAQDCKLPIDPDNAEFTSLSDYKACSERYSDVYLLTMFDLFYGGIHFLVLG